MFFLLVKPASPVWNVDYTTPVACASMHRMLEDKPVLMTGGGAGRVSAGNFMT